MERVFENSVKMVLVLKLLVWALVTLFGAFLLALPGLFSKQPQPDFKSQLAADDPYSSGEGDAANIRALRYR